MTTGDEPGRRHRRRSSRLARPLGARRRALVDSRDVLAALRIAVDQADWLDESDAVGVVLLGELARRMTPVPEGAPQLALDGSPVPVKPVPHAEWIALLDRLAALLAATGLTARGRLALGLHLVPPTEGPAAPGPRTPGGSIQPRPSRRRLSVE